MEEQRDIAPWCADGGMDVDAPCRRVVGVGSADGIGVENSYGRRADRTGLEDGTAFLENIDDGVELIFGDSERGALDGCNALAGDGVAEVEGGGDDHAGRRR